jgi:LAGLIDADG-like domain/Glycosyl transferases group 1
LKIFGFHDNSGCGMYRVRLPLGELAKHGHEVKLMEGGTGDKAAGYQVIVAQRTDKYDALPVWRRFKSHARLVYEIDDDVFSTTAVNWMAHRVYSKLEVQDAVSHAAEVADMVTVTTPVLAEVMSRFNANVRVLPNHVPAELLEMVRPRRDKVTVGWAGGASHAADMAMVAPQLRRLVDRDGVELHLIGTDYSQTIKRVCRFSRWEKDLLAYYANIDFDIGVAPLTGTTFDKSKCVDSGMRISTNKGVLEAGSLKTGMKVWRDGWRKIQAVKRELPRPGLLVTLDGNYQLKLTPDHRMLVNGEWTRTDNIKPGDRIAMESETVGPTNPVCVPWPADSRMSRSGGRTPLDPNAYLSAPDGPRLDISPRWGRFLGAFAGDGSVGQSTVVQISCDGQDQDWIGLVMDDFRAFGLNPTTEAITMFDGQVLRRRGVRVASAHLLRVLASLGVTRPRDSGNPIRVPCVPEVIWRSPRDVIAEFLAGYFESDGHCTTNGVKVLSKTEQLIRDVQRLLLLFGITSIVRSRTHSAQNGYTGLYWSCDLRRAEADVFAKEIGFRSERKQRRLAEIVGKSHSHAYRPMVWSRAVTSVEPCMVTPVDIQVEGSTFVLAGFVSHNSSIKALEYAGLGIPVVASDCEPYRQFVIDGVTGFLVRREHEWSRRLRELVNDAGMREEMGVKAREQARNWTIDRGWKLWAAAYEELLS